MGPQRTNSIRPSSVRASGAIIILLAIGYFGMWEDTMRTISMILVCTVLSVVIGIPIGIVMSRSEHVQNFVNPVLDVMQTMPSFVYLIPVVMLLGIGKVPGLIAVVNGRGVRHGNELRTCAACDRNDPVPSGSAQVLSESLRKKSLVVGQSSSPNLCLVPCCC